VTYPWHSVSQVEQAITDIGAALLKVMQPIATELRRQIPDLLILAGRMHYDQRRTIGLSQEQYAERLGWSLWQYRKMERRRLLLLSAPQEVPA